MSGPGVSATDVYGPEGRRFEENVGGVIEQFVYRSGGQNVIVLDGAGNILQDEGIKWREASCRVGARHLATLVNGASTLVPEWELSDWLGGIARMPRMAANTAGAPVDDYTNWPYGANLDHQGIVSGFHFTDKYHDSETGFDYFGARYYSSGVGRFLTPDWSKNPEGVPYANYANPQSLNLYGYVLDNPATATDPDGHWCFLGLFGSTCGTGNANSTDKEGTLNTTSRTPKKSLAVVASAKRAWSGMTRAWNYNTCPQCETGTVPVWGAPEGELAEAGKVVEGAATLIEDVTRAGSTLRNVSISIGKGEFEANLEASGWARSISPDGAAEIFTKDGSEYAVYTAKSTSGPTAQFTPNGAPGPTLKIRLGGK